MFKNCTCLLEGDSRKPRDEFAELRAIFEILKQCGDRNARAAKHPSAANSLWVAFNGRTRRPINHVTIVALARTSFNVTANAEVRGAPTRAPGAHVCSAGLGCPARGRTRIALVDGRRKRSLTPRPAPRVQFAPQSLKMPP